MSQPYILQFGAGNIGRSLVGPLFTEAGYEVIFVDAVSALVDELNQRGSYPVRIKDALPSGKPEVFTVNNVSAVHASDTDTVADFVAGASMVCTAVGANAFPHIFSSIAKGLQKRSSPVSILLCENMRGAATQAREELFKYLPSEFPLEDYAGLVETSIGKMVPLMPRDVREQDPLEVWGEAYSRIIADADGFIEPPPHIEGLELKHHFEAYVDRKLFVHNLGHSTAAYFGFLHGKTYIWESMGDRGVAVEVENAMRESGDALKRRYAAEFGNKEGEAELENHIQDLLRRFANQALGDTVFRVGRDLPRKLGSEERCLGALRLATEEGLEPRAICRAIAAAFHFFALDENGRLFERDRAFHQRVAQEGVREVLENYGGTEHSGLAQWEERILEEFCRVREMH